MTKFKSKKAFTFIELLVVISVLSVLILLAIPKLLTNMEKAELVRIQHDVRVMENEFAINLHKNYDSFEGSNKDLSLLVLSNKLFDREGYAKNVEYASKSKVFISQSNHMKSTEGLGVGGDYYSMGDNLDDGYKIIPEEYKKEVKSKLKGTFHVNESGKVYYEHSKTVGKGDKKELACSQSPLPDYTFEHNTGKIVKYHGNSEHLIIPSHFLVDGECWPVRIIGKAAFMQGGFKSILIPDTVIEIGESAFEENELTEVIIPGSVKRIGYKAFNYNNLEEIVYRGSPSQVRYLGGNGVEDEGYPQNNGRKAFIKYKVPTPGQSEVIVEQSGNGVSILRGSKNSSYIPPYLDINGSTMPTKKIAKGAYQGLGLISVTLPETLEVIEDYAFAGNQLTGITIPNSVYHIGHYAFSFNEVWTKENERKATIKTVIIKEQEQFNKIDKYGDIHENNEKVEILSSSDSEKGPDIRILNHIWSTSIDNVVIEEEYTPDGCWRNQSNPIVFCGLGPQAYDGDLSTHHGGKGGVVTWKGNLAGKKVFIKKSHTSSSAYSQYNYFMYVKDKDGKNIDFLNLDTGKVINVFPRTTSTMNILVPENAESFYFSNGVVYEIQVDSVKNPKSVYDVTSTVENTSVTLNWKQNESDYEKSLIYRNDELIAIVNGHSYKDPSLYADTEYKYEIYAMNKYGNINLTKITHHVKTTKPEIIFKGLGPESFDGNLSTHHGGKGGTVTWEGDLAGKKVLVKKSHTSSSASSSYNYFMYVRDKDGKNIQFLNLDTGKFISSMPRTTSTMNILVPENAESFYFSNGVVYEVQVNNIKMPESVYDVTSIVNNTNITLNWKQNESDYEKSLIYRNNELIAIVNGHSYKDPSLYADTEYEYKIYAMNKYGNVDLIGVNHNIKTTRPEIVFKGLGPESFDGNLSTHHGGKGGTATWEGDLAGKKVLIKKSHTSSSASSSYNYFMYVRDKDGKNIQFLNLDTNKIISSMPRTTSTMNILVPENAESFYFSNGVVYEIQVVN